MMNVQLNFAREWMEEETFERIGGFIMEYGLTPEAFHSFRKVAREYFEEKGRKEDRQLIILNMLSKGLSLEETAELTGINIEEIQKISESK